MAEVVGNQGQGGHGYRVYEAWYIDERPRGFEWP